MINLSELVEADFLSVTISSAEKSVKLLISDRRGIQWSIHAEGVDDVLVTGMRRSNIIDRVNFVAKRNEITDEVRDKIYFLMREKYPLPKDLEWSPFMEKIHVIEAEKLCFLEIEPVYGAMVLLLAKKIEVKKLE